jgi:hypothetical protein
MTPRQLIPDDGGLCTAAERRAICDHINQLARARFATLLAIEGKNPPAPPETTIFERFDRAQTVEATKAFADWIEGDDNALARISPTVIPPPDQWYCDLCGAAQRRCDYCHACGNAFVNQVEE